VTVEILPGTVDGVQDCPVVMVEKTHVEEPHVLGYTVLPVQDFVAGQKLGQWCDLEVFSVLLQQPTVVVKFP
jgi:hypothetical protein